jgi:fucose 4-O-acetylase-like acetyltransferase
MAILWLGWSFYFVENYRQKFLLCAIGIGFAFLDTGLLWGFDFASPETGLSGSTKWLVTGSIFLAFVTRVPAPSFTKNIFNDIGAATFYIFIFNGFIIKLLEHTVHIESVFIVFCLTMIGSMSLWWGMERLNLIARLKAIMNTKAKNQA